MEEELNNNNKEQIKIVEKGVLEIKDILESENLSLCTNSESIDVVSTDVNIPCNTNNVGYRWLCVTCKERDITQMYEGETEKSARI